VRRIISASMIVLIFFSLFVFTFEIQPVKSFGPIFDGYGPIFTQLTHNDMVNDRYPCISGDGSKIAFESDFGVSREIFVVNSDGSGLTQLTDNSAYNISPSISGDGSKIAFDSDVDGDYEIFVVNSDGLGLTQLTHNTANDEMPSISGDGSKIAFTSHVDGDTEIFLMNSDGSGLTQLTHNTVFDTDPSISGDGSKIAFTSYVDGDYEIFVVNSDGSGLTQLTDNIVVDQIPSISGDGSKIAFHSGVEGTLDTYEIFVVNSDGLGLTQLTHNTAFDAYPSISGDGSKIAFESNGEIFVVNSDGSGLTQLTSNTAANLFPSISGDGSKIAFQSSVEADWEIFLFCGMGWQWRFVCFVFWMLVDRVPRGYPWRACMTATNYGNDTENFNIVLAEPIFDSNYTLIFWSMGDAQKDGYIDDMDIDTITSNLGWVGPPGENPADINSDGIVDIYDAVIASANYGLDIWTWFGLSPAVGKQTVTLSSGNSTTLIFTWNATEADLGSRPIYVYTTFDSYAFLGNIFVTIPGDINGDQYVNAKDAIALGTAFYPSGAYNPYADINGDSYCNAKDAVIIGTHFNEHWE
jgi:Tol biopolymer transport system component